MSALVALCAMAMAMAMVEGKLDDATGKEERKVCLVKGRTVDWSSRCQGPYCY